MAGTADQSSGRLKPRLPEHRDLYYGGTWQVPASSRYVDVKSPSTGESLGRIADPSPSDVDKAVAAAQKGFAAWRLIPPLERAAILKRLAAIIRDNAQELALLDAVDCGNPVREMVGDAAVAAAQIEFFAGLVTEMKGASIPMGPDRMNFSVREPLGVVARIIPFNHPFMFAAGKAAAPLAAGNTIVIKPPDQAPLSTLRLAELAGDLFPPGVFNVVPGGREVGAALSQHPGVAKVALIGSVGAGRAVMAAAASTLKGVLLELGGKNALIAFPDASPKEVAAAAVAGMNFTWCGQSCGSTSRAFIHDSIYDEVVGLVKMGAAAYRPGLPDDPTTTMGAIASQPQFERIMGYIESAKAEGATLVCGGGKPADAALKNGWFIEPTVFAEVTPRMKIAREEIFGPVLGVLRWKDEAAVIEDVNSVEYGLTCSIWTNDISVAYRTANKVDAGYVWINEVGRHFLGAPFGGVKQSGIGREECLEELLAFTREKNIHVRLRNA